MRWCTRADALFAVPSMHVVDVVHDPTAPGGGRLVLTVESDVDVAGCPVCGVIAGLHARREHTAAVAPCFGTPTRVVWRKRGFP